MYSKGEPLKTFLIVCEGTKTESLYFKSFPLLTKIEVFVHGAGANTESLVREAIKQKKMAGRRGLKFDQIWCVFDKDDFPYGNVQKAFQLAKKENVLIAFSNEAFELWYLLHFDYVSTEIGRDAYISKLKTKMTGGYEKNSKDTYSKLQQYQKIAIKNAKRLYDSYANVGHIKNKPSTTVFKLVEELNKYIQK